MIAGQRPRGFSCLLQHTPPHIDWQGLLFGPEQRSGSEGTANGGIKMSKKTVSSTPASALSPIPETIPSQLSPAPSVNGAAPSDLPIESFFAPPTSTVGEDFNFAEFRAPATPTFVAVDEGISAVRVKKPDKTTTFYVHETWREYAYLLPGTQK